MKITYMGKVIRDDKGRFARRKRMKRKIKNTFLMILIGAGLFAFGKFQAVSKIEYISPTVQAIEIEEPVSVKIERMKDSIVNDLIMCESRVGSSEEMSVDNLINYDPDDRQKGKSVASVGVLKFKVLTFMSYWNMFYQEELTPKQAVMKILDDNTSKELAKKIIFEDKGKAGNNWFNCFNKQEYVKEFNLKTRVEAVKLLVAETTKND